MAKENKTLKSEDVLNYMVRTDNRNSTIAQASMGMIGFFMGLGDDQPTATDKSDQISYEILKSHTYAIEGYERGNSRCKTDLIDAINAINETTYPFFDAAAKAFVIGVINV